MTPAEVFIEEFLQRIRKDPEEINFIGMIEESKKLIEGLETIKEGGLDSIVQVKEICLRLSHIYLRASIAAFIIEDRMFKEEL